MLEMELQFSLEPITRVKEVSYSFEFKRGINSMFLKLRHFSVQLCAILSAPASPNGAPSPERASLRAAGWSPTEARAHRRLSGSVLADPGTVSRKGPIWRGAPNRPEEMFDPISTLEVWFWRYTARLHREINITWPFPALMRDSCSCPCLPRDDVSKCQIGTTVRNTLFRIAGTTQDLFL